MASATTPRAAEMSSAADVKRNSSIKTSTPRPLKNFDGTVIDRFVAQRVTCSKFVSTQHQVTPREVKLYSNYLMHELKGDIRLCYLWPLPDTAKSFALSLSDGVLVCAYMAKSINSHLVSGDNIDFPPYPFVASSASAKSKSSAQSLSQQQISSNWKLFMAACQHLQLDTGTLDTTSIPDVHDDTTAQDLLKLLRDLILFGVTTQMSMRSSPELQRLQNSNESLCDFLKLPIESVIVRWINYILKPKPKAMSINCYDLDCGTSILRMLQELYPATAKDADDNDKLVATARLMRISAALGVVLDSSDFASGRDFSWPFFLLLLKVYQKGSGLSPTSVASNHSMQKMYTVERSESVASVDKPVSQVLWHEIFNQDAPIQDNVRYDASDVKCWIESVLSEKMDKNQLLEHSSTGIVGLRILERLKPGAVRWDRVQKHSEHKFHRLDNCQLLVKTLWEHGFNVTGIKACNIEQKHEKLTLALYAHMMNYDRYSSKQSFGRVVSKTHRAMSWVDQLVNDTTGQLTLTSGLFYIVMIAKIWDSLIDIGTVTPGQSEAEAKQNCQLALDAARHLGVPILMSAGDLVAGGHDEAKKFITAVYDTCRDFTLLLTTQNIRNTYK